MAKIELILSHDWGKAGELALALGWRPCGRHFETNLGLEGHIVNERDDFTFWPTKGSILHIVEPLSPALFSRAQYILDMGRATAIAYGE